MNRTDSVVALRKAEVLLMDIAVVLGQSDQEERAQQCIQLAKMCSLDADLLGN